MIYFSGTLKKLHKGKRKPNKRRMKKIMNRAVEKMIGKKTSKAIRKVSKEEKTRIYEFNHRQLERSIKWLI